MDINKDELQQRTAHFYNAPNASGVWVEFENNIRYKNRLDAPDEIIEFLEDIARFEESINEGEVLYRARVVDANNYSKMNIDKGDEEKSGLSGLGVSESGAAPDGSASPGRANPIGISYLYLANAPETACAEVSPTLTELISVMRFQLNRTVNIINLNKNSTSALSETEVVFLKKTMQVFMEPKSRQDDVQYAPSQFIAQYIQKKGYDGIKYIPSHDTVSGTDKYSLVLFDPTAASCKDEVGEVYRLIHTIHTFQNISLYDQEPVKTIRGHEKLDRHAIDIITVNLQVHLTKNKK